MNNIYDYENNINVITTVNGDKVITMNVAIYISLLNSLYDSAEYAKSKGHPAMAEDRIKMWKKLGAGWRTN